MSTKNTGKIAKNMLKQLHIISWKHYGRSWHATVTALLLVAKSEIYIHINIHIVTDTKHIICRCIRLPVVTMLTTYIITRGIGSLLQH